MNFFKPKQQEKQVNSASHGLLLFITVLYCKVRSLSYYSKGHTMPKYALDPSIIITIFLPHSLA